MQRATGELLGREVDTRSKNGCCGRWSVGLTGDVGTTGNSPRGRSHGREWPVCARDMRIANYVPFACHRLVFFKIFLIARFCFPTSCGEDVKWSLLNGTRNTLRRRVMFTMEIDARTLVN